MKEFFFQITPRVVQEALITLYNIIEYKKRYGKRYLRYKKEFLKNNNLTYKELQKIQESKYKNFIQTVIKKSPFYKNKYSEIEYPEKLKNIRSLPIIGKEEIRNNISKIYTISESRGVVSKTGGTTGKSLKVLFTLSDMKERFALLDNFRERNGYKLGKKTAWFSGKTILVKRDILNNRFWKTDWFYKVRYYSTFHISEAYLKYYTENLIKFKPEFLIGFPSSLLEIAKFGLKNKYIFPKNTVKAIFPTAETITFEMRSAIELFFNAKIFDQYASSEGAPFIFECNNRNLHIEMQSGIFEVLDYNNSPTTNGRLVVTSFTTNGTPLVRYDIGDNIELSSKVCNCENNNPLVNKILGRIDDFIYSPENGKINLGNVSNTVKGVKGIVKFQVIQDELNKIVVNLVIDDVNFNKKYENVFLKNWRDRLGNKMCIELKFVNQITTEKSGKYRIVKNNIKHLLNS